MAGYLKELYASGPETAIFDKPDGKKVNSLLLGTWLGVLEERADGWLKVITAGQDGWVHEKDTRDDFGLKVFFIDVGQGDSCLLECGNKRLLIDGGPGDNTLAYLKKFQYSYIPLKKGAKIHLDAVFITHFDEDHFKGIISILDDNDFTVGTIYHNGIARFATKNRPKKYDSALGETDGAEGTRTLLKTSFSSLSDAKKLVKGGGLLETFRKFLNSALRANHEKRLGSMRSLNSGDKYVPGFEGPDGLIMEVLGPLCAPDGFKWF